MYCGIIPSWGRFVCVALILAVCTGSASNALEQLEFGVQDSPRALEKDIRAASILLNSQKTGATAAPDLFADARAEYANLLNALYARGYYSPVIHVFVDGVEAANIAPLDAPSEIKRIKVTVDPGPAFVFSRAQIAPLERRTALPLGFAAGQSAQSGVILEAVTAGVDGWRNTGHAKAAAIAQNLTADHDKATLSAEITLDPGPRLRFGRLVIEGRDRMREDRIRAIAGLPEGEVFSPLEVARATSRLRRSGVFKSATLTEDKRVTTPGLLGFTATLVEEKRRRYTFGAEIASFEGLRLTGAWLHRNLLRGGERLEINGAITNIGVQKGGTDYQLGISFDRPATFTPDTSLGFGLTVAHLNEADFTADLFGATAALNHVFSESLTARAGFAYNYAAITDPAGRETYRTLSLPISVTWDRRDSKTDATKRFYIQAEVKPFLGFGITDSGTRLKLDLRGYKALDKGQRFVLAARFQAGAVLGASLAGTPRDDLFYSGGGGTVRGQPYQSLGINFLKDLSGVSYQTGGKQFLAASLEARTKVTEKIGIVGFVDIGRVDFDGFFKDAGNWHAGAGLGVRYATGVGPIRLDLAVPVGGKTGEGLQIYVGLGQSF